METPLESHGEGFSVVVEDRSFRQPQGELTTGKPRIRCPGDSRLSSGPLFHQCLHKSCRPEYRPSALELYSRSCSRLSQESELFCLQHRMKRLMRSTLPWQSSRLRSLASLCLLDPSRFSVSEAPPCTPRSSLLQDWLTFPQYAAGRVGVLLSVFHAGFSAWKMQLPR